MSNQVDKLVAESRLEDVRATLEAAAATPNCPPELLGLREEFQRVQEELTGGDWGRIGVLAGLLWLKLDTMIKLLGDNNQELKNIGLKLKK